MELVDQFYKSSHTGNKAFHFVIPNKLHNFTFAAATKALSQMPLLSCAVLEPCNGCWTTEPFIRLMEDGKTIRSHFLSRLEREPIKFMPEPPREENPSNTFFSTLNLFRAILS